MGTLETGPAAVKFGGSLVELERFEVGFVGAGRSEGKKAEEAGERMEPAEEREAVGFLTWRVLHGQVQELCPANDVVRPTFDFV